MRKKLFGAILRGCLVLFSAAVAAENLPVVDVYENKQCGCCGGWVEHMRNSGFKVHAHDVDDVEKFNQQFGVNSRYGSCHVAKVGNYVVVGHVPPDDVQRLLKENPQALGLSVPGMPAGSPGMESNNPVQYDSLLLKQNDESTVFQHH
jgi:hypothetical protein